MIQDYFIRESEQIQGIWEISPSVSIDSRGSIWTSYLKTEIENIIPVGMCFRHDKFSESRINVLRGIHGDEKSWKLVTCAYGNIQQVIVDLRPESPTMNKYVSYNISSDQPKLILIPPMMGNSYLVLSEVAVYHYKLAYHGKYIDADRQFSKRWNDPCFNIDWAINNPVLSDRDKE